MISIVHLNLVSICVLCVTAIYYYFKNVYSYWKKRGVVGPEPILFFGNIKESALRRRHVAILLKQMYDEFSNEKMVGFYKLTLPSLLIRDLDIVKQILIRDFEAFPDRGIEFSKQGLGDNLFHCDLITWKALKSHLTPVYTTGQLRNTLGTLKDSSDKFVDYVKSICLKNPEQEVTKLFQKYTMASIMASAFGINIDSIYDNSEMSEVFEKIGDTIFRLSYAIELDMLFPGILKKTHSSIFNGIVQRFCYEVVRTVKSHKNGRSNTVNDITDVLLTLQEQGDVKSPKKREGEEEYSIKVTDDTIAGQVFIFFAAGYGNNTNALSYAMYHLAKNPDIQNKLMTEIDGVLEKFNGNVTYDSLEAMTYLDQIFYETLRKHPITTSIQRCAGKDYVIPGTNLEIEQGISIVISPLAIHHDEKLYPNPTKFDPERFAPGIAKNRHSCAYLPFGAGPRSCLGIRFAKLQFKTCAVKLLSKYRVEISRRTKDEYFIDLRRFILCPEGGIYLNIIPRSI